MKAKLNTKTLLIHFLCLVMIFYLMPMAAFAADRTQISDVAATSDDFADLGVYGTAYNQKPSITVTAGAPAYFNINESSGSWEQLKEGVWSELSSGTITAGTWRFTCQIRIDENSQNHHAGYDDAGEKYELASSLTVKVSNVDWVVIPNTLTTESTYSYVWVSSPEFEVPDHVHVFDRKVADNQYLKSAADCENPAVYYKSCTCGAASTTDTFTSDSALGHSYGAWTAISDSKHQRVCTTNPNHKETASHRFSNNKCTDCGYELENEPASYRIIAGANSEWAKRSAVGLSVISNAPFAKFACVKVDGSTIAAANYIAQEGSTWITLSTDYLGSLSEGKHSIEIVSTDGSASTYFTITAAVPGSVSYILSFNMNGYGTQVKAQTVDENCKPTKPSNPTASGYTFGGWYKDSACTDGKEFDFNTVMTADVTVYAKWTKSNGTDPTVPKTGDESRIILWAAVLVVSGGALIATLASGRKKKVK